MTAGILTVTLNPAIDLNYSVERIGRGDLTRASEVRRAPGGKGIVVSRMLAELGVGSEAACLLGGPDAEVFLDLAKPYPFHISPIRIGAPTRTNTVISESTTGRQIKVNAPGPRLSPKEWRACEAQLIRQFEGHRWIVMGGGLPPGVPATAYARLIRAAHRAGAKVALDASGDALTAGLQAQPDLVKPNRQELEGLLGGQIRSQRALLEAAGEILRIGARSVVITNGRAAVYASDGTAAWSVKPPTIQELSPVGAGDSMLAGIVARLNEGDPLDEALRWGVACGTATAALADTILAKKNVIERITRKLNVRQFKSYQG